MLKAHAHNETRIDLTSLTKVDGRYCDHCGASTQYCTSCGAPSQVLYNPNKQDYRHLCRPCLNQDYML